MFFNLLFKLINTSLFFLLKGLFSLVEKIVQCNAKCPLQLLLLKLVLFSQVAIGQVTLDNSSCNGNYCSKIFFY